MKFDLRPLQIWPAIQNYLCHTALIDQLSAAFNSRISFKPAAK